MKNFIVINFGKHFKFAKEKLYSKLSEEQNIRKVAALLYIFFKMMQPNSSDNCVHCYNIEIL